MAYDPLTSILFLIVGLILGRSMEKARWIEKYIDTDFIKKRFGKKDKETSIAE